MFNTNKLVKQLCISGTLFMSLPFASVHAVEATTAPAHASYIVKNLNIGELPVKTIVPITAKTKEQAIAQAKVIAANKDADIAEFRIDLLEFASDSKQVIALGQELNQILKDKPLLATIRTANEGGKLKLTDQEYEKIYAEYLKKPFMQLLDIEMFRDPAAVAKLTKLAHQKKYWL